MKEKHLRQIALVIIVAFIQPLLCFADDTPASDKGLILIVEVVNGTANGHPVIGDEVTVSIYEHEKLVDTIQRKVGAGGTAIFENIKTGDHLVALPAAFHKVMKFTGRAVALKPTQQKVTSRVAVWDISYDNSELSVQTHHLIIKQKGNLLTATEYIQLKNPSDLAISSNQRDNQDRTIVLTIPLPKGFKNFRGSGYLVPEALGFTKESFYDTMAVPPGVHEVVFSYNLEITSDTMNISKKISLPTVKFVLFSQLGPDKIRGLDKPAGQMVLADTGSGEYFTWSNLEPGQEITFQVGKLSINKPQQHSWMILSVVFGFMVLLAVWRSRSAKNRPRTQ